MGIPDMETVAVLMGKRKKEKKNQNQPKTKDCNGGDRSKTLTVVLPEEAGFTGENHAFTPC